jgi:hypothetical protein
MRLATRPETKRRGPPLDGAHRVVSDDEAFVTVFPRMSSNSLVRTNSGTARDAQDDAVCCRSQNRNRVKSNLFLICDALPIFSA